MIKYFIIEFENEELCAVDEFRAIDNAIHQCCLSIFGKYDLRLMPPVIVGEHVVLEIRVPEDRISDFVVGRQLRSISDYLVHNYDGKYTSKKGFRLLRYIEIPKPDFENDKLAEKEISDFEVVARIIDLLKSNKTEDKVKIENIKQILKE